MRLLPLGGAVLLAACPSLTAVGKARADRSALTLIISDQERPAEASSFPASATIQLHVADEDDAAGRSESSGLRHEHVVTSGTKVVVYLDAPRSSIYQRFGFRNLKIAHGHTIAT